MKTMKKIVAILAVALMLCSILPLSVFAADTQIVFELGANGSATHNDGSEKSSYSATVDGYTLSLTGMSKAYTGARDAKGNSCIKLGTGSAAGKFSFTVPNDVTSVIINVAKYKSNTSKVTINGTTTTLTKNSNDGAYDAITVDTTATKTVSLTTVSGGYRAMVNTITFVVTAADPDVPECEHVWVDATCTTPKTCSACGAIDGVALGHSYEEEVTTNPTCVTPGEKTLTCACGDVKTETVNALGHNYVDGVCENCGADEPAVSEYTITFDANKTQRTDFSSTKQVWADGPLTFTNNKASSSTAVADYGAPVRLYAGSEIVIECPGMTQIVFDCNSTTYANSLKSSIGTAATVSGDKVTVLLDTEDSFTVAKLTAQIRIDSMTVTAVKQGGDQPDCEHTSAKACDKYCPDCSALINEAAAHKSNAQYPCYEGACEYCGEAMAAEDHVLDADDICTICGLAPTPEKPVDPENPQLYTFSEFAAGTQYAEGEKHFLDNAVTVITTQSHFTTQLRIYSSSTHNGNAVIKSKKNISAIVLNAGNESDVLNLYVSEDGVDYTIYETIEVTSAYKDHTVLIPEMTKYIKLDVEGEKQVRIAKMTLYFDGEAPHTCEFVGVETQAPTCGVDGVMTYSCTCGKGTYTEAIPATGAHTYDHAYDVDCNVCGAGRDVVNPSVVAGTSASEDVFGVAALFNVNVSGLAIAEGTTNVADYTNATLGEYKLISMGVTASNGTSQVNIPCVYLWSLGDDTASFAARVINIPEHGYDTEITFRSYFVVEIDGVETTIYGDVATGSYNAVIG